MPILPPPSLHAWPNHVHILRALGVGSDAEVFLAQYRTPKHAAANAAQNTARQDHAVQTMERERDEKKHDGVQQDSVRNECRWIALKSMHPHLQDDASRVARFYQEAARFGALEPHPNLVQFYGAARWKDRHTQCMEFIDGMTLRAFLDQHDAPLPPTAALDIVLQLLSALEFLHKIPLIRGEEARLIHGDLSPHNVMIDRQGCVKLIDFGVATARWMHPERRPLGTIPYTSPEQCAQLPLDPRSDLFVLGVLWWEMLEGTCPYTRFNHPKAMWEITEGDVPAPSVPSLSDALRDALQNIWGRLQSRDLDARFDAAVSVRGALQETPLTPDRAYLQRAVHNYLPPVTESASTRS